MSLFYFIFYILHLTKCCRFTREKLNCAAALSGIDWGCQSPESLHFLSAFYATDLTPNRIARRQLQPPFSNSQDYEVLLTRFCALAFGWVKVGQTCLPVTKHPREWQLYLFSSVSHSLTHTHTSHTHTHTLACGQCTDVITDIPGCYLFFTPLRDAFDKWYHK